MGTWQVQGAKQRFSEVVRAAQTGEPQFITKHGEPVAVIVDIEDYRNTHEDRPPLVDYLLAGLDAEGFELPDRRTDPDRAAMLFEGDE